MGRHAPPRHAGGRGYAPPHRAYAAPPLPPPPPPPRSLPPHHGGAYGGAPLPGGGGGGGGGPLERDVAAFVAALRASRSDPSAPPNALNVRDAIQAICAHFGSAAYDALCGAAHQPPALLRAVQTQHERVWSFVTCYQHARRVHTLFECHQAFLAHEGLRHFGELGIGNSFLHTDAVQALYHAPASIYRLTTKDVLTAFRQFESVMGHDAFAPAAAHQRGPPQRIDREQFKQFLAQQRRQPSAEAMGLYIDPDGFGPYIAMLRRIAKKEQREIHELQDEFNKGIADRVFELSKEKFSAENRQQALAELLQRTNDARATELARGEPLPAQQRQTAKKATATLSSLSLEILSRVTDVDVYLDNMLRWKSADERYKSRLASHTIADTDQKIRTQLTQFLLASQKSRHHARVKVVTWVLCGILAKIHTLLQLDDKIPEAKPTKDVDGDHKNKQGDQKDGEDDDEGEECDCCCVGEDTCRCRCQCECHQDESDDDEKPSAEANKAETAADETTEGANDSQSSPMKRKRSRSRSGSVVVSFDDVKNSLESFLAEQLDATQAATESTESAVKLLASAESHLRTKFAGRLGDFSVLNQVAKELDVIEGSHHEGSAEQSAMQQITECIHRGQALVSGGVASLSSVSKDEVRDFVIDCFEALADESGDDARNAVVQQACAQFGLDRTDKLTKSWLDDVIADVSNGKGESTRSAEGSIVHYARAIALPSIIRGERDNQSMMNELALLEDDGARDQVIATKTAEARTLLAQCPYLLDVGEWSRWRARFEPFCGSLRTFLRSHEMIRLHDDHASSAAAEFVCCTNDQVMKIRGSGNASASALDSAEISPEALALELVSLFVQHRGSASDFPRELVVLHIRSNLKRIESGNTHADSKHDLPTGRARFVLNALLCVPQDFAAFVWGLLEEAASVTDLDGEVFAACQSRIERRRLHVLSELLCKPKWRSIEAESRPQQSVRAVSLPTVVPTTTGAILAGSVDIAEEQASPEVSRADEQHLALPIEQLDVGACEAFIHKLRREQFGIGLEIADADTRAVLQAQHRRLERALKRLSDELYSEKTHFVLELLQNADDNKYPTGTVPRGEFVLTKDGTIVFANNEIGFSERNIQAICDVGASTKEQEVGDKRSIGKKGIGFKSVFKVSDVPEVHSNGFHIQFHAKDEQVGRGLGYILPYWIDARTRWKDSVGTTFVLPLNDHSMQRQREISDSLLSFEPSVLLFLQKIRELRLMNEVTGGRLVYEKHEQVISTPQSGGAVNTTISMVTLQSERVKSGATSTDRVSTTQRWFIIRRLLEIPNAFAERGQHTEIAIAVPDLDQDDQDREETQRPPLQQVFCYLPLRSYGFRFIVQGDFEVPSSREAISNGSDWNQWLISQYPALVPALVSLVGAKKISLHSLLRVLPLDSDIQAPFRSIVADISREMRQLQCFPTAQEDGGVCTASELLDVSDFADDGAIDFLLQDATLVFGALQKRVMALEVSRAMPPLLKAQLRIERLRASHVLRLLAHVAPKRDATIVLQLLQLLVKLARHDRHRSLLLQELRRIKCFPVQVGRVETWLALADVKSVLFVRSMHAASKTSTVLVDELCVLSDMITPLLETQYQDTRRFLIDQLGVKELEDHDLAIHHILPAISKTPTVLSDDSRLVWREHVKFLATHLVSCGASCALRPSIRQSMRAITWSGRVVSCDSDEQALRVVLPSDVKRFESSIAWLQGQLTTTNSSGPFDVVALGQLAEVENDALRALWVDCCKLPELFDPHTKGASEALGGVVEWIQNEQAVDVKRRVSGELARYLDSVWSSSIPAEDGDSAWWQRGKWLEGSDGNFSRPSELWVASPAVVALFSRSMVPVTKIAFESETLRAAWQLKTTPTVDDVINVVRAMSEKFAQSGDVDDIDVDVSQMTRLYAYLLDQSRGDEVPTSAAIVRKAFVTSPLIFLPANEDVDLPARFSGLHSVVWSTGGSALASVATALDTIYPKTLRAFFVGVCGVERKPTIDQLQQELGSKLAESSTMSKRKWTANVLPLLQMIAKALAKGKMSSTQAKSLKKALKGLAWIPGTSVGTDSKFKLCSMKRSKARVVAFPEEETGREILRLCSSLVCSDETDPAADFVALEDSEVLRDLMPLLRLVGAVSVRESLVMRPAEWCRWLARLGASTSVAVEDSASQQRLRARKKYEKLLKKVLLVWAEASSEREPASEETALQSTEFETELSTQSLFPTSSSDHLERAVDLFLNDQHDLSQAQLQHPSLRTLNLFSWDHFVASESASDLAVLRLLLDVARMRSLAQHLHTEVVLLGPDQPPSDESFALAFQHALRVAQRVVFHQHASSYARLDHAALRQLLSSVQLREVAGDARALQLLHRVATTDFTLREATACHLDKASRKVFVVAASESPTLLFDVLRDVCRQCLGGASIATSVANVLYLASMQPTQEALEAWLVHTQNVPPLDARAGKTLWVDDETVSDTKATSKARASKRERRVESGEDLEIEDGEVSDDDGGEAAAKRAKHILHAWDQPPQHQHQHGAGGGEWATGSSYEGAYHHPGGSAASGAGGAMGGPYRPSPYASGMASLAFSGSSATSTTNGLSDEEKLAIGRWGEEYVFLQLQQSYADRSDVVVEWVNQQEESGLPYDIVVKTGASHDVEYVEVKSTKTMEKGVFEISMNELDQAATHGSRYCIYRVFNAGNAQLCRVVRMKNPIALVRQKKISLVLLMQ